MVSYSATITYKWNAVDNPVKANGLPPKYLKLYYGSVLRTYTNSITVPLTNINTTNIYTGYDQYNCNPSSVRNYVEAKVIGNKSYLNQFSFKIPKKLMREKLENLFMKDFVAKIMEVAKAREAEKIVEKEAVETN